MNYYCWFLLFVQFFSLSFLPFSLFFAWNLWLKYTVCISGQQFLGGLKDTIDTKLTLMPQIDDNLDHTLCGLTQIGNIIAKIFSKFTIFPEYFRFSLQLSWQSVGLINQRCCEFKPHSGRIIFHLSLLISINNQFEFSRFQCHSPN